MCAQVSYCYIILVGFGLSRGVHYFLRFLFEWTRSDSRCLLFIMVLRLCIVIYYRGNRSISGCLLFLFVMPISVVPARAIGKISQDDLESETLSDSCFKTWAMWRSFIQFLPACSHQSSYSCICYSLLMCAQASYCYVILVGFGLSQDVHYFFSLFQYILRLLFEWTRSDSRCLLFIMILRLYTRPPRGECFIVLQTFSH